MNGLYNVKRREGFIVVVSFGLYVKQPSFLRVGPI